jgi:hypothetical protein
MKHPLQIRTGGQSGVDRAALDACLACGVEYVGWCPRGGWAEDHPDPPGVLVPYPGLTPTPSADPAQRTAWNVRDSHAVLVLVPGTEHESPGTSFAERCARLVFLRPWRTVTLPRRDAVERAAAWLSALLAAAGDEAFVLGVGGPRESESPGIYEEAYGFMVCLFEEV